jgi:DNA mismatch endonuclease (patch repair protein)
LAGKPDLVFAGKRVVVFLDGCFWHGCPNHYREPRSNAAYWRAKIERNVARDARVTQELVRDGWIVLRFWEHQVKTELPKVLAAVEGMLSTPVCAAQEEAYR